jgi:tetratricopeptide (TPR) repeat protein
MLPFLLTHASSLYGQGEVESALQWYAEAVAIKKDDPQMQYNYAVFLNKVGKTAQSIEYYERAIEINPELLAALDNLAWLLATHPDGEIRNGQRAVELAGRACQLTDYQEPLILDCLAAAYAETGRFTDALRTAQNALVYAQAKNLPELELKIKRQIDLFKDNKPYREDPKEQIKPVIKKDRSI